MEKFIWIHFTDFFVFLSKTFIANQLVIDKIWLHKN